MVIHFKNFEADEKLRIAARLELNRIVDRSPVGSTAVALLEKEGGGYRCSVDVYSRSGPFMATSNVRPTALEALAAAREKITGQMMAPVPARRETRSAENFLPAFS